VLNEPILSFAQLSNLGQVRCGSGMRVPQQRQPHGCRVISSNFETCFCFNVKVNGFLIAACKFEIWMQGINFLSDMK
jgi:hypothetical protein